MKKLICSFLFVAGSLFFAACSSDSGNDDPGAQTPAPELKTPIEAGNDLYGIVIDNTGSPIEGVVVSDGFSCVESDANGVYQMARNKDAYHVFYRIPADRAVPIANGGNSEHKLARHVKLVGPGRIRIEKLCTSCKIAW